MIVFPQLGHFIGWPPLLSIAFFATEMAKRQGVSVETFRKWRKAGLQAEPNPTGKLLFDLNKVNNWRKDNAAKKEL